jgi:membrane protease subunit HflC
MLNFVLGLFLVLFVGKQFIYVVYETEKAVKLEFGKLVSDGIEPGWHFKLPLVNSIKKFDARILTVDARPERFLTVEKKAMMVDLYAKWRITDEARYYQSSNGDERNAERVITQRINEGLRNEFGVRTLHEVVSGERDQLMVDMTSKLNETIGTEYGVEVVDVRVKRIDLPDEVSGDVYNRMRSEREREARKHRFEGKELAEGIRADADRQKIVIQANAFREAEQIRGEGDARSTAIYASAYNQDPEFYSFLRSLQAYKASFGNKSDMLLVDPDSDYFKYLKNPNKQ